MRRLTKWIAERTQAVAKRCQDGGAVAVPDEECQLKRLRKANTPRATMFDSALEGPRSISRIFTGRRRHPTFIEQSLDLTLGHTPAKDPSPPRRHAIRHSLAGKKALTQSASCKHTCFPAASWPARQPSNRTDKCRRGPASLRGEHTC